jgi:predicted aldo/keto reductase-like oxidoreductase
MERRDFLKKTALGAAATATATTAEAMSKKPGVLNFTGTDSTPAANAAEPAPRQPGTYAPLPTTTEGGMKYRILGDTGEKVSIIGIGGFHLAKPGGATKAEAIKIVRAALDQGMNFCDNAWDYNNHESEKRLGDALQGGYRNKAFVMTKIDGRTATAAMGQIEQSLKWMKTDRIDLLQFHEIIRTDDPVRIFAPGGALEAVLLAQKQGKIRYIGFTGHKSPYIHREMFETAEAHRFHFDTVQMPVNIMDAHFDSFQSIIFPIAMKQKTAMLAMKTFGDKFVYEARVAAPIEMLHYSMSQPVAVVITGIDQMLILDQALEAIRTYKPMTEPEQMALLARSAKIGATGKTEKYKVSEHFDSTAKNPRWLTEA